MIVMFGLLLAPASLTKALKKGWQIMMVTIIMLKNPNLF